MRATKPRLTAGTAGVFVPLAHGAAPPNPSLGALLAAWPVELVAWLALGLTLWAYATARTRVPKWPGARSRFFFAGLAVVAIATCSPIAVYEGALLWVHMVQHLLLTLVAAPLLVLGAPGALLMRAASVVHRRRLASLVHLPVVRALSHPVTAWCAFALVMWVTHFSGIYNLALENEVVHSLEHLAYLSVALLFWWPVAGLDPGAAGRLSHPLRLLYLLVALPQQSFLGVAILSASDTLYSHYATLRRSWGPSALADQELAGVIMWVLGDMLLLAAIVVTTLAWMRHDARESTRMDRRLDAASGHELVDGDRPEQEREVVDRVPE